MNESMDQEKRPFYFTFGIGQGLLAKRYVRIDADAGWKAREVMHKTFGSLWASMYGAGDYDRVIRKHGLHQLVIGDEPIDVDIEFGEVDRKHIQRTAEGRRRGSVSSPTIHEINEYADWSAPALTPTQAMQYLTSTAGWPGVVIVQEGAETGDEYDVLEITLPNGRKIDVTVKPGEVT